MFDERLTEDDWSPYLAKAAGRGRQRAKEAAMRARSARGHFISVRPPEPKEGEVFQTSAGTLAYVKKMPNMLSLGNYFKTDKATHTNVSLPWVSLLGKDA